MFFFKQKTAYEVRISDWSSDVCSSDLDGSMLSKPESPEDAANQLRRMVGTRHRLFSAAVAARDGAPVWRAIGEAKLWMRPLSDAFIAEDRKSTRLNSSH